MIIQHITLSRANVRYTNVKISLAAIWLSLFYHLPRAMLCVAFVETSPTLCIIRTKVAIENANFIIEH